MRSVVLAATIASLVVWPATAWGQMGGYGGRGGMGDPSFGRRTEGSAPRLPGAELEGPPDSATIQPVLNLNPEQAKKYAAVYDSFMVATKPQRDSAQALQDDMYQKLDGGDRAAALFYAGKLQRMGDWLKDRQQRFEDRLADFLTSDQVKAYRQWRKDQDRDAEAKAKDNAIRWRTMGFGGMDRPAAEAKTFVDDTGLPHTDAGSQAVRVGRTVYVSGQVGVDDGGNIVGGNDLRAQATRAFANLTRVLGAANALPEDVVRLAVYVVGYRPADLEIIREAGAAYFPARHQPVVTVLGVESLSREGLLVAIEATAVQGSSAAAARRP